MSPKRRPTLRAVRLGQELRKLREAEGISLRQLASELEVNSGRLSKKESGWLSAKRSDVDDYLNACNVHDPKRRESLYKICDDVFQKGWWEGYAGDIAAELMDRIWLESKATKVDTFETIMLPGLLQTPSYAEGLMRLKRPEVADLEIRRWIEVRTTRQHILTRHNPIKYDAIIDESILKRCVKGPDVMKEQLDYLLKAADQKNITLRVLPLSAGMHISLTGAFEVLTLEAPYPEAGLLQIPGGDVCVEGDTVDSLADTFNHLQVASLSPQATKKVIATERDQL